MSTLRAKALLLLAVFLSAGTSLPSLDGLLFHQDAEGAGRAQTHVEPAGGCLEHAGHCVLGRTASGSGADATPSTEVTVEPISRPDHPLTAHSLLSAAPSGIPHSRAPPVLLA
jgi:hypothetical protein